MQMADVAGPGWTLLIMVSI